MNIEEEIKLPQNLPTKENSGSVGKFNVSNESLNTKSNEVPVAEEEYIGLREEEALLSGRNISPVTSPSNPFVSEKGYIITNDVNGPNKDIVNPIKGLADESLRLISKN